MWVFVTVETMWVFVTVEFLSKEKDWKVGDVFGRTQLGTVYLNELSRIG